MSLVWASCSMVPEGPSLRTVTGSVIVKRREARRSGAFSDIFDLPPYQAQSTLASKHANRNGKEAADLGARDLGSGLRLGFGGIQEARTGAQNLAIWPARWLRLLEENFTAARTRVEPSCQKSQVVFE